MKFNISIFCNVSGVDKSSRATSSFGQVTIPKNWRVRKCVRWCFELPCSVKLFWWNFNEFSHRNRIESIRINNQLIENSQCAINYIISTRYSIPTNFVRKLVLKKVNFLPGSLSINRSVSVKKRGLSLGILSFSSWKNSLNFLISLVRAVSVSFSPQ